MHLGLFRREHLQSDDPKLIGSATTDQFQRTHGALQAWAEAEHKDDGAHGDIHADSIEIAGGITAEGDGIFGGDVVALNESGNECGIGNLQTVNEEPLLPNEVVRQGLLLGGIATGTFLEWRGATTPFTSGRELAIWNLAHSTVVPILRIGLLSGVPTVLDGGTGADLAIGSTFVPMTEVVGNTVQGMTQVKVGGLSGAATLSIDAIYGSLICDKTIVPSVDNAQDLGYVALSTRRWRDLYLSRNATINGTVFADASIYSFAGEVYAGLYFREAGRGWPLGHWTPYTPTWQGTATNPTLGNGSLTGRYTIMGKTVNFQIRLVIGSTTTLATGLWTMTPPVLSYPGARQAIGTFVCEAPGIALQTGIMVLESGGPLMYLQLNDNQLVTSVLPFAWTTGYELTINGRYEMQ